MGTQGGSGGNRPDGAGKPRILARDAGPGSCAQEAGAGLAGAGFAVSAGFVAGLASVAGFASAFANSGLGAALSVPSTRFRFLLPSFLKSVSYQPLPASRNDGAVTWRRTCPNRKSPRPNSRH